MEKSAGAADGGRGTGDEGEKAGGEMGFKSPACKREESRQSLPHCLTPYRLLRVSFRRFFSRLPSLVCHYRLVPSHFTCSLVDDNLSHSLTPRSTTAAMSDDWGEEVSPHS